jgi:hypothetical protein
MATGPGGLWVRYRTSDRQQGWLPGDLTGTVHSPGISPWGPGEENWEWGFLLSFGRWTKDGWHPVGPQYEALRFHQRSWRLCSSPGAKMFSKRLPLRWGHRILSGSWGHRKVLLPPGLYIHFRGIQGDC